MLDSRQRAPRGPQTVAPAQMDPELAELAARIPVEQIPYAVAWLSARFWLECTDSRSRRNNASVSEVDRLLTAGELAKRLGVPESWVRSEERARRIPGLRLGKYVRFRWCDVERALTAQVRERTGPRV
jgi:excisionase family DNA binding protein